MTTHPWDFVGGGLVPSDANAVTTVRTYLHDQQMGSTSRWRAQRWKQAGRPGLRSGTSTPTSPACAERSRGAMTRSTTSRTGTALVR